MHGLFVILCGIAAHEEPSRGDSDELESKVVVTTGGCRACARHGPFDFAQGRLPRAPVPTRAGFGSGEQLLRFCWCGWVHGVKAPTAPARRRRFYSPCTTACPASRPL